MSYQKKIICLMGATAAGKTDLAVELTQTLSTEIISVDSGMIYRGMDIGTAKPTDEQLATAPHRLINICDPSEPYSAAKFRDAALQEMEKIFNQGKIPLLVGGTMLYFKVLQQGISVLPSADQEIRARIAQEAELDGWEKLHQRLKAIDPESAAKIAINDAQRIQRALEVYELSGGEAMSKLISQSPPQPLPYQVINVIWTPSSRPKQLLRIERRLQEMLHNGFVEEVEQLIKRSDLHPDLPSMRAVGYRQIWRYLSNEIDYQTMQQQILIATRQLAKRQLTWLRGQWQDAAWFDSDDEQERLRVRQFIRSAIV